jgi:hypothetical protein
VLLLPRDRHMLNTPCRELPRARKDSSLTANHIKGSVYVSTGEVLCAKGGDAEFYIVLDKHVAF